MNEYFKSLVIESAGIDPENGVLHVLIDGYQFWAGEKYTILEMGWAVYRAKDDLPHGWLAARGETRPADEDWNELASSGEGLVTSHPVLVALSLKAWWHRNDVKLEGLPLVAIPTLAEAITIVRSRKILNEFNRRFEGDVPGLTRWGGEN